MLAAGPLLPSERFEGWPTSSFASSVAVAGAADGATDGERNC